MYENLKRMYLESKLKDEQLEKALTKGWITEEQFNEIREAKQNALGLSEE